MRSVSRLLFAVCLILIISVLALIPLSTHRLKPESITGLPTPTPIGPTVNELPTPIYVGERIVINQTRWSPNSQRLWFTGSDLDATDYKYEVATGQLTALEQSPFIMRLTAEQQTQFEAFTDEAFQSPNGQYAIYQHVSKVFCEGESGCQNPWALGDLQTGQFVFIQTGVLVSQWVIWSDDSHTALLFGDGPYGGMGGVYFISNFSSDLDLIQSKMLMNYSIGTHSFVDLLPNGTRTLIRAHTDGVQRGLYVWDGTQPHEPHQFMAQDSPVIFNNQQVSGAAFMAPDRYTVIAVTDQGIAIMNVLSDEPLMVNPIINATWVEWAYFSPNKEYVAVIPREKNGFSCKLFVLPLYFKGDVSTMLEQAPPCSSYG